MSNNLKIKEVSTTLKYTYIRLFVKKKKYVIICTYKKNTFSGICTFEFKMCCA